MIRPVLWVWGEKTTDRKCHPHHTIRTSWLFPCLMIMKTAAMNICMQVLVQHTNSFLKMVLRNSSAKCHLYAISI